MLEYSLPLPMPLPLHVDASLREAAPYDMFPAVYGDNDFGDEPPFSEHVYDAMEAHMQAKAQLELEASMAWQDRALRTFDALSRWHISYSEAEAQAQAESEITPFERAIRAYDRELADPLNAALREVYGL